MSANQEAKKVLVEEIKNQFKNAKSIVFVDYRGLTVTEDTALRKKARENGVTYKVYKNRMMLRALQELGITGFDEKYFEGTTSVAIGSDEVGAAKIIADAIKDYSKMEIKFGVLDGNVIDKNEIEKLAKTPDKKTLIAMLLGQLKATMSALCREMDAIEKKN